MVARRVSRSSTLKGQDRAAGASKAVDGASVVRAHKLTLDLVETEVVADIEYAPIGRESAVYKGVRLAGVHKTAGGNWILRGQNYEGWKSFRVERIKGFTLR